MKQFQTFDYNSDEPFFLTYQACDTIIRLRNSFIDYVTFYERSINILEYYNVPFDCSEDELKFDKKIRLMISPYILRHQDTIGKCELDTALVYYLSGTLEFQRGRGTNSNMSRDEILFERFLDRQNGN